MANEWQHKAACRHHDGERWFPHAEEPTDPEVLKICRACPVRTECGIAAARTGDRHGIFAGYRLDRRHEHDQLRDRYKGRVTGALVTTTVCDRCGIEFGYKPSKKGRTRSTCQSCIAGHIPMPQVMPHVLELRAQGFGYRTIAKAAQLPRDSVANAFGRDSTHVSPRIATAVLALRIDPNTNTLVRADD